MNAKTDIFKFVRKKIISFLISELRIVSNFFVFKLEILYFSLKFNTKTKKKKIEQRYFVQLCFN